MANTRYIGIKKESSYGTLEDTTNLIYSESVESLKADMGYNILDPVASRNRSKALRGDWRIKGSIGPFDAEPENGAPIILFGALGSDSKSDLGSGAYKHTITPADTLPTFNIRTGLTTKERRIVGALVEGFELSCRYQETVKLSANIISGKADTMADSLTTPTFSTLQPFTYVDAVINVDGSAQTTRLYDVSISFSNGLIDKGNLGSRTLDTVRLGIRSISGKFSSYFTSYDDWTKMIAGTAFKLEIILTGVEIAGGIYYEIHITLPKCVIKGDAMSHVMPMNEPLVLDVPFEALWKDDTDKDISIEITNTRSSAY